MSDIVFLLMKDMRCSLVQCWFCRVWRVDGVSFGYTISTRGEHSKLKSTERMSAASTRVTNPLKRYELVQSSHPGVVVRGRNASRWFLRFRLDMFLASCSLSQKLTLDEIAFSDCYKGLTILVNTHYQRHLEYSISHFYIYQIHIVVVSHSFSKVSAHK